MEAALIVAALVAVVVGLFAGAAWFIRNPSKRGASAPGSALMSASFDEVFHPHAAASRDIVDAEQRLVVPAPAPDDDLGIADGRIRLDLQ